MNQQNQKSLFITFEGGECTGKSTQADLLQKALKRAKINSVITKEPGGTKAGQEIRELLLNSQAKLTTHSQLLLLVAARAQHLHEVILPSLKASKTVVCDRFFDSTMAYQSYAHGVPRHLLGMLHKEFVENIEPDLTFVFDVAFTTFKKRMKAKHAAQPAAADRYESLPDSFHKKVLDGFRNIAAQNQRRCILIDTNKHSEKEVHECVKQVLRTKFGIAL